jgi:ADP-ribosyl-[dinitrogen reductase] hydrolase
MNNNIRNGILGLVVGDALGVPVEFKSREYLRSYPVTDMIGYGTYNQPPGTWSDDSSLTLCLADELSKEYNLQNIANRFARWYDEAHWTPHNEVFDIGISTRKAISNIKNGIEPIKCGGKDERSNGNGSLMRILPLLFHIKDIDNKLERFKIIRDVSSITHAHIRSVLSCYYYLEFADLLCKDLKPQKSYKAANKSFKDLVKLLDIDSFETDKFKKLINNNISKLKEPDIQSSGYVIHTLEASVWCILTTNSYSEAVLKSVNLGDDTDTTAAVTGGLAGIIYTTDSIPENWLNQIARLSDIEDVIQKLTIKYNSKQINP